MHDQIGAFEIIRELGRGGMGVVYLAHDPRLDRSVAIKALPGELASDPVRLERFEREARTLASLNHPNLAGIHGIEEQDGDRYLVLEYVAGESLADRLDRGPLPIDEAVELAVQIAAGMESAHEAGIIHRDLKPANIVVTPDGVAKVLDFGLARHDDGGTSSGSLDSPTMTIPQQHSPTFEGAILGTAAYMSPEQARGRRVDRRSDIWSFGVVLYEMLVGQSPFRGETASDSIGAVLHKELDLGAVPPETPDNVRRVLERCLVRDRAERFRDIGDLRIELLRPLRAAEAGAGGGEAGASRGRRPVVLAAVMLTLSAVGLAAAWNVGRRSRPLPDPVVRKFDAVHRVSSELAVDAVPQIAPDGSRIAFIHERAIHIRNLDTFESTPLPGTEGAQRVCWSPDGEWLAFMTGDRLSRIPARGGGVTALVEDSTSFQFSWSGDDQIVSNLSVENLEVIAAIPVRGGEPRELLRPDESTIVDYHAVCMIPGTDVLLYVEHLRAGPTPIRAWDGTRTVTVADQEDLYLTDLAWSPTGHVLYSRGFSEMEVWAVPFDASSMEVTGDPFLVMNAARSPSVSADGTLSVLRGGGSAGQQIIWVSLDGDVEVITTVGDIAISPLPSPDGNRIVFASGSSLRDMDVWVRDLERGVNTRLMESATLALPIAWSPDGAEIAVAEFETGAVDGLRRTLFVASDGTGETRPPYPGMLGAFDEDWTVAALIDEAGSPDSSIIAIDLEDLSRIGEVVSPGSATFFTQLNREGSLLLYQVFEDGDPQLYCTRFPSGTGRWQVSADGGSGGVWSPDESSVYYVDDGDILRVPVTYEPALRFGVAERLSGLPSFNLTGPERFTFAQDGARFVRVRAGETDTPGEDELTISVIQNWYEEFRGRKAR